MGDLVCTLNWTGDMDINFKDSDQCDNDEVRSGILIVAEYGTVITLYDSPDGSKDDDYTVIKVKTSASDFGTNGLRIDSFEQSQTYSLGNGTVEMTYHSDNGLDGKISRVEIQVF